MNKTVSLAITSYKAENLEFVIKAIDSADNQTYKNIEIIVVNNNDINDKFYYTLKKELSKFPKIIVLETKKASSAQIARNLAVSNACGEYIKFLDDDDFLFPDAIERLVNTLEETNAQMVYGPIKIHKIGVKNKLFGFAFKWIMRTVYMFLYSKYKNQREWFLCTCNYAKYPCTLSTMFNREFLKNNGMWNENYLRLQDSELIARLLRFDNISYCNHLIGTYNNTAKMMSPEYSSIIKNSIYNYLVDNNDVIAKMNFRNKAKTFIRYYIHALDSDSKELRDKIYILFWGSKSGK